MAFVQAVQAAQDTAGILTVPAPFAGIADGDLLLAYAYCNGGSGATLTPPGGWTLVDEVDDGIDDHDVMWLYTRQALSEPGSYDWDFSVGSSAVVIMDYTPGVVDVYQPDQGETDPFATTPFTATNPGEIIVLAAGQTAGQGFFYPTATWRDAASTGAIVMNVFDDVAATTAVGSYSSAGWNPGGFPWLSITVAITSAPPPPPPTITSITPNNGSVAGGTPITIAGTNFDSSVTVTFPDFGGSAYGIVVVSPIELTAFTPAGVAGLQDVTVTTLGGFDILPGSYTYTPLPVTGLAIPILTAEIAFDPTDIYSLTQTWTDVSIKVRDFQTKSGKQHFLDRIEAGTLTMTVDGRDGFFLNGGSAPGNGTGKIIQPRLPIKITATWGGITYPVFYGLTDSALPKISDAAAMQYDISITASDLLKQLSLHRLSSIAFWENYANSTSTENWYRCDVATSNTAVITSAVGNGTTITYKALNNFSAADNVTITGLTFVSGSGLNLINAVIDTATATEFTILSSHVAVSQGPGAVYRTVIKDEVGGQNGYYMGIVSFPQYGAMIYDLDGCVDVANGGTLASGYLRTYDVTTPLGAIDFWILGQDLAGVSAGANTLITIVQSGADQIGLEVNSDGQLVAAKIGGGVLGTTAEMINDGYWHHIGLVSDGAGDLELYADGAFTPLSTSYSGIKSVTGQDLQIGILGALNPAPAYYDEIIFSNTSSLSTIQDEVHNRWIAGSLLQRPTNNQQALVQSGDRIAEILCLAGFGTIVAGAIVLNTDWFFINNSGTAWVKDTAGNGFLHVEPFYWDTPVTTSSALDLIAEVTDTDIGLFFQRPDGTVNFFNQLFYGTWDTALQTWTPSYTAPSGDHVWTDDASSDFPYLATSLQVPRDDADVWTIVSITPQAGIEQIYENVAAVARWGSTTLEKSSTLHRSLAAALHTAQFLGYIYRDPLPRVDNVELRAEFNNGAGNSALFAGIGDPVHFKHTAPGASTTGSYPDENGQIDTDFVVESVAHDFSSTDGYWHTSFALDPYPVRT